MHINTLTVTASNYDAEANLEKRFLLELQKVIDNGGQVVSIIRDDQRIKKAYVIHNEE